MSGDHTAYIEILAHMNCGNCGEYWGLSDLAIESLEGRTLYCPHCGYEARVEDVVEDAESG
jgi:hypothetical protein